MTPIPWPSLSAEEKRSTFWKSMGVEPIQDYRFECVKCHRIYENEHADCCGGLFPILMMVHKPITLDALFALVKERKIDFYVEGNPGAWKSVIFGGDSICIFADNPIDALAIALLRHAGLEVLTEGKV